ncbi:MAG: hypothetical protein AAFW47_06170 [Pseudomonadota bacterium]
MMKYLLAVAFVAFAQSAGAAGVLHPASSFKFETLKTVDFRTVDCDELKNIAADRFFVKSSRNGEVVASGAQNCSYLHSPHYAFFFAEGLYTRTRDGICNVWSCSGRTARDSARGD